MAAEKEQYPELVRHGRWFAVLALLTLALFGIRTISHSDFWMTLTCGRWIAAHGVPHADPFSLLFSGKPWLDPAWLYDLMTYELWTVGGATLVILVHVAAVLAAFGLLIRAARPFGGWLAIAVALLVAAWLLAPAFMVRARLFTLFFPALFIFCLSRGCGRWGTWLLLLPAQVLWTNMHHTFRLGPVICLAFAAQAWLLWRQARRTAVAAGGTAPDLSRASWLNPLLLAAATLAATLVNPYGPQIYRATVDIGLGQDCLLLAEPISVFNHFFGLSDANPLIWAAAVVNLMGLVAEKERLPVGITLLALLGTGLAILSPRYATIMAVFSFPFFVLSIRAAGCFLWDSFTDVVQHRQALFARLLLTALVLTMAFTIGRLASNHYYYCNGSGSSFGLGVNEEALPTAALSVLEQPRFPQALLNNPLDGGHLLWHLPQRKVFLDARAQFQGLALLQLTARAYAGDPAAWQTIEARLRPAAVLVNCCQPQSVQGLRHILGTGHWSLAYFDGTSALLLLDCADNRPLLENPQLKTFGLTSLEVERRAYERRIAAHWFPTHSPTLIGAGQALMALTQYSEAEKVYALLTRGAPHMFGAWLNLGICRGYQEHWPEARTALRRATEGEPKNALAWLWLGLACERLDLDFEARAARQHAQKLNPVAAGVFDTEIPAALKTHATPPRARQVPAR